MVGLVHRKSRTTAPPLGFTHAKGVRAVVSKKTEKSRLKYRVFRL
jgi:hypothetical protein